MVTRRKSATKAVKTKPTASRAKKKAVGSASTLKIKKSKPIVVREPIEELPLPKLKEKTEIAKPELDLTPAVPEIDLNFPMRERSEETNGATNFKKSLSWVVPVVLVVMAVSLVLMVYFVFFRPKIIADQASLTRRSVVKTELTVPEAQPISSVGEGREVVGGEAEVELTASAKELEVPQAVYTVKEAFEATQALALGWATDAALISIKSLGAVSPTGQAEGFQILFGSKIKSQGLVITVLSGSIAAQQEVNSSIFGYDLPNNWYDSNEAIVSLRSIALAEDTTVSAVNFYYNTDGLEWYYAFATSRGTISMPVR